MKLNTFNIVQHSPVNLHGVNLSLLPCGLFRCPLDEAPKYLPELAELFESVPVDNPSDWEIDVKIHMLMKDQYPCIPNWHCDNVPRDSDGKLRYDLVDLSAPKMLLWVSDEPTTEFLSSGTNFGRPIKSHDDLAMLINTYECDRVKIPSQTWIEMDQLTPHRGTKSLNHTWRIFVRVTHKSLAPQRPVDSIIRRHCQVYLDAATFSW
jgi:hypothetical protein